MQVKKQQLEPDMEKQAGSKLGKEYIKARTVVSREYLEGFLTKELYIFFPFLISVSVVNLII